MSWASRRLPCRTPGGASEACRVTGVLRDPPGEGALKTEIGARGLPAADRQVRGGVGGVLGVAARP